MRFEVKKMGINGEGIAYLKRKPVFIEGALVGETVSAHIKEDAGNFYVAKLDRIIKRSSHRIIPLCPYFKDCGACQIMHMDQDSQNEYKLEMIKEAFIKYCDLEIAIDEFIVNDSPLAYRNSLKLPIAYFDGKLTSGLYRHDSNHLLAIDTCMIHDLDLERAKKNIINVLRKYHYRDVYGLYMRILDGNIQAVIVTGDIKLDECIDDLFKIKGLVSLYQSVRKAKSREFFGKKLTLIGGQKELSFDFMHLALLIRPQSFMQLNTAQAQKLYQKVIDLCKAQGKVIFEAYAGIGIMSLLLAKKAKKVIGVEIVEMAISDAKKNAKRNHIENVEFIQGDSAQVLKERCKKEKIDVLIVDPPRVGLDELMIETIKRAKIKEIIYVSCNMATLAKNYAELKRLYVIDKVIVVDMFSNSAHVETVVLLGREFEKSREHVYLDYEPSKEIDLPGGATYSEIKQWIQAEYGLKVSSLYVAQVKQKHGIVERECYNKPKSENAKQPKCPPEKEAAIEAALKHFKMI